MSDRTGSRAVHGSAPEHGEPVWLLVDTLAGIVDADTRDVRAHMVAMNAHGTPAGQRAVVALMAGCGHPRLVDALDLLARDHPDATVAREARKTAMRVRTRMVRA